MKYNIIHVYNYKRTQYVHETQVPTKNKKNNLQFIRVPQVNTYVYLTVAF